MQSQSQLRQQITNLIIAALEQDCVPWRRPWSLSKNTGRPGNALSKRPYSGINPLLLEMHAVCMDFSLGGGALLNNGSPLVGLSRSVHRTSRQANGAARLSSIDPSRKPRSIRRPAKKRSMNSGSCGHGAFSTPSRLMASKRSK